MYDKAIATQATRPKNRGKPEAKIASSGGTMKVSVILAVVAANSKGE